MAKTVSSIGAMFTSM